MLPEAEIRAFDRIIEHLGAEKKLYVLHSLADGDAIAAGFILSAVFGGVCAIPDSLSSSGKRVSEILDFEPEVLHASHVDEAGCIFLLDVSSLGRIGDAAKHIEEPVIIDHHALREDRVTPHYFCFPERSSTAEIIYDIIRHAGVEPEPPVREAALLGILCDTGHLRFANARTFESLARILSSQGATLAPLMDALEEDINPGKSVARLKAAQRMRFQKLGDRIVAWSFVSCFEASACRAMLNTGADVALVASGDGENFRLCGRAKESVTEKGLNLGIFFQSLSGRLPGEGGGHAGAASFSGKGHYRKALSVAKRDIALEIRKIDE